MKNLTELCKRLNHARRAFLLAAASGAASTGSVSVTAVAVSVSLTGKLDLSTRMKRK